MIKLFWQFIKLLKNDADVVELNTSGAVSITKDNILELLQDGIDAMPQEIASANEFGGFAGWGIMRMLMRAIGEANLLHYKIESEIEKPIVKIIKNIYKNFEHVETGFVFDKSIQKVIGKQVGDKVVDLSDDDKLKCKEFWFQYEYQSTPGFGSGLPLTFVPGIGAGACAGLGAPVVDGFVSGG